MQHTVKTKYLKFPVNTRGTEKRVCLSDGGKVLYALNIRLDNDTPDFYAYIDVSRFMGMCVDVTVSPDMPLVFEPCDAMDREDIYKEPLRPQVHFTTKNGWNNDPNGLVYADGVYHLFYQHNPADPIWGNMHWGHATSRDLVHWEECDIALFPDERGMMYSGSAIMDDKNVLGQNTENSRAIALFYTTTEPFCQNLSWSTDGFATVQHCEGNPIVPHIADCNRDPKVVFCEELGAYVMALYLTGDIYALLISQDLHHWEELQRLSLEGDNECPDLFVLKDEEGHRHWVLMGAHDCYAIGDFTDGRFTVRQPSRAMHYGNAAYAAQSFSGMPDGRVVRMAWDRWCFDHSPFRGQMGIPVEMSLQKQGDTLYLCAVPVCEFSQLYTNTASRNVTLKTGATFETALQDAAYVLSLQSEARSGRLTCTVFGNTLDIDLSANTLRYGTCSSPLYVEEGRIDLTAVIDRASIEVFADGGRIVLTCLDESSVIDREQPHLQMTADCDMQVSVKLHSLESIWNV